MHLNRRAITALRAIGVSTIGKLIGEARKGIVGLRAAGVLTTLEITGTLDALSDAVTATGDIDWLCFAERRSFTLLPAAAKDSYSARDFLWHFPRICEEAVISKLRSRRGHCSAETPPKTP